MDYAVVAAPDLVLVDVAAAVVVSIVVVVVVVVDVLGFASELHSALKGISLVS